MRELSGLEPGGQNQSGGDSIDRLLEDAGTRWRESQPAPAPIDAVLFVADRRPRFRLASEGRAWSFLAGAASAVALLVAVALVAPNLVPRLGGGGPATPDASAGYIATGLANCPLTKPDGSFTPTEERGADYDIESDLAWYGSARLWTLLHRDGEIWTGLTRSEMGMGQKTFWWRQGYRPSQEPRPEISVTGKRLDGPGRFGFGPPGTNASFGLGSAMLVGIEIPEAGCWQITARYGADELTIVVFVDE
jgi:hypothetical protein